MTKALENLIVQLAGLAAAAIPLTLSILNAAPEPYWLDCPEFTAAAQTLGIPHPPGHPLYVMLVKPFTLLPLGSIALRVSVASAVFGAGATYLLFLITRFTIDRMSLATPRWLNAVLALVAALLTFASHAWWFQSVRQEVYSLQALIVMGALYGVLRFSLSNRPKDRVPMLYLASFLFGLGLANHHFIMLVALPAAIPALVRLAGSGIRKPARHFLRMCAAVLFGMTPYLFLPLRSYAGTPIALGGVHSPSDFLWVVTAKVYQKSMSRSSLYLQDTPLDAIMSIMGELGPIVVVIALAGLYMLLRRRSTRLAGTVLALVALVTLLMRAFMGFDPFNPDYFGYVLPTIAVLAATAAIFVAVTFHVLYRSFSHAALVTPILAAALFLVPVFKARDTRHSTDLSEFRDTRILYDFALGNAPPDTVVVANYYKLFFALWSARYIDGSRPDIHVVNPQFFGYPGYLASVTRQTPALKDLAWSIFVKREITERAISSLAQKYTMKIDPSAWTGDKALQHLQPDGLLYTAFSEPVSKTDVQAASTAHFAQWRTFYNRLGTNWKEHETWRFLSWSHYQDAIYFARMGVREAAAEAIHMSTAIGAATEQINGLEDALKEGTGPVDVTPFLLDASDDSAYDAAK